MRSSSPRARGLTGVLLCISDVHEGLKNAIAKVPGGPWQRCTVRFLRDMLGYRDKAGQPLVSGAIRQIFAAESDGEARQRLTVAVAALQKTTPRSPDCSRRPRTTCSPSRASRPNTGASCAGANSLEHINHETGRRSDVVGIYPNDAAPIRLAGSLLIEQHDFVFGLQAPSETTAKAAPSLAA